MISELRALVDLISIVQRKDDVTPAQEQPKPGVVGPWSNEPRDADGHWVNGGGGQKPTGTTGRDPISHAELDAALAKAEAEIRNESHEHAVVISPDGHAVQLSSGAADRVEFDQNTLNLRDAVLTHNHPGGHGLSVQDGVTAFGNNLAEMRAVTKAGDVYSLARAGDHWPADLIERIQQADKDTYAAFSRQVAAKYMTAAQAEAQHADAVYTRVAKRGDVRYTHTKP